jgi:hypothetical protein
MNCGSSQDNIPIDGSNDIDIVDEAIETAAHLNRLFEQNLQLSEQADDSSSSETEHADSAPVAQLILEASSYVVVPVEVFPLVVHMFGICLDVM